MLGALRLLRGSKGEFDADFAERHPDYWPIRRAARTFRDRDDWPEPAEYGLAFEIPNPPVRFVASPPKRKRPEGIVDRTTLYDAVIVRDRIVSTRPRMWHDYLNALVWATFPNAKLALHRRQHAAIEEWIPEGATQLPNARTRELDALALVDEGGILYLDDRRILFGHALFEGLVFDRPAMIARGVMLESGQGAPIADDEEALRRADALLAEILDDSTKIVSPDELPRLPASQNAERARPETL